MTFTFKDTSGALKTIARKAMITEIDGRAQELYVTEVKPFGHQRLFRMPTVSKDVTVKFKPFAALVANVPSYGDLITCKAQVSFKESKAFDPRVGSWVPVSKGCIVFRERTAGAANNYFKAVFHDELEGLFMEATHVLTLYTVALTRDHRGKVTGSSSVPTVLSPVSVETQQGFVTEDNLVLRQGMAEVKLKRSEISAQDLKALSPESYFTLAIDGGDAEKYYLYNGSDKGAVIEKTHHICVYLTKARIT